MKKVLFTVVVALVLIGVARGIIRYNEAGGEGFQNAGKAIILAVEDITFRWIGPVLGLIGEGASMIPDLISGLAG